MGGSASYRYGKKISAAMAAGASEEEIAELRRKRQEAIAAEKARRAERKANEILTESNNNLLAMYGMKKTGDILYGKSGTKQSASSRKNDEDDHVMSAEEREEYEKQLERSVKELHEMQRQKREREEEEERRWNESDEGKRWNAYMNAFHDFEQENERHYQRGSGDHVYISDNPKKLAEKYLNDVVSKNKDISSIEIVRDEESGGYRLHTKGQSENWKQLFSTKKEFEESEEKYLKRREEEYQRTIAEIKAKEAQRLAEEQRKNKSIISRLFKRK